MPTSARKNFNPSRTLIQLFVIVVIIGTFALKLPGVTVKPISIIDAVFTATSAVCVTGLTIHNTGSYFTRTGQIIILILIQIGALGYMSLASLLILLLRRGMNIKGRLLVQQQMTETKSMKLSKFILNVVSLTLLIELIGAVLLAMRLKRFFPNNFETIYMGIFHSISAFCNAGFDVFTTGQSMSTLNTDIPSVLIVSSLIIIGGLGYVVINDLMQLLFSLGKKKRHTLSMHSKIVILMTSILLLTGTVIYFIAEYSNPSTFGNMKLINKFAIAFFQSVTPRTAGFSMVDTSSLLNFSIIFTIILMFIGASPGGTGGGVKTTTFAVVIANVRSIMQEQQDVNLFKRRIMISTIRRSVALFALAIIAIISASLIMSAIEQFDFRAIIFEVTSAFATVGLTTGITPHLHTLSKVLLIVMMLVGRLGPLTFGDALIKKIKKTNYRYPEERIAVG